MFITEFHHYPVVWIYIRLRFRPSFSTDYFGTSIFDNQKAKTNVRSQNHLPSIIQNINIPMNKQQGINFSSDALFFAQHEFPYFPPNCCWLLSYIERSKSSFMIKNDWFVNTARQLVSFPARLSPKFENIQRTLSDKKKSHSP